MFAIHIKLFFVWHSIYVNFLQSLSLSLSHLDLIWLSGCPIALFRMQRSSHARTAIRSSACLDCPAWLLSPLQIALSLSIDLTDQIIIILLRFLCAEHVRHRLNPCNSHDIFSRLFSNRAVVLIFTVLVPESARLGRLVGATR